jgi:transglutaminase-like putative cysteine protease
MKIQVGCHLAYECAQATPMLLMLSIHYSRAHDIVVPDRIVTIPDVPLTSYRDGFGNWCTRLVAPPGRFVVTTNGVLHDSGVPECVSTAVVQHPVENLPAECLVFLLGSRYCETDRLSDTAWSLFGGSATGAARVQAVCDYVHRHIEFGYQYARPTRTALEAFTERKGVCRDYAHLAIAFCRCLNIPARYCTGYLGDIGMPPPYGVMDFAAWFEVYLDGRWETFDARNNMARIGRVLVARGRDATDIALSNVFGPTLLTEFRVWTEEVASEASGEPREAGIPAT